jgi:hypothetical protein
MITKIAERTGYRWRHIFGIMSHSLRAELGQSLHGLNRRKTHVGRERRRREQLEENSIREM